jgi:hypothetical protein
VPASMTASLSIALMKGCASRSLAVSGGQQSGRRHGMLRFAPQIVHRNDALRSFCQTAETCRGTAQRAVDASEKRSRSVRISRKARERPTTVIGCEEKAREGLTT